MLLGQTQLGGDITEAGTTKHLADLLGTDRQVLPGTNPRSNLLTQPALIQFGQQPAKATLAVLYQAQNQLQKGRLAARLSVAPCEGTKNLTRQLIEQTHVLPPNSKNHAVPETVRNACGTVLTL
jgi:hypothetical protein